MAKTTINIKADADVKKRAQKTAEKLGLPLSVVVNAYLKQFIRTGEVYFSLGKPEGELKPAAKKRLDKLTKEARAGKNLSPAFENGKDMDAYLNSLK